MSNGFTEHNYKGLFTFYKQQDELQKINENRQKNNPRSTDKRKNNHYTSLSNYQIRKSIYKQEIFQDSKEAKQPSNRYSQIQLQNSQRQKIQHKKVLQLSFNLTSNPKKDFYFQLIGSTNRRNKIQIQNILKKQHSPKIDFKRLINQLSVREMQAGQVRQLFKAKKDYTSNIHGIKRNPLKMNSIAARCVSQQDKSNLRKGYAQDMQNQGKLYIPSSKFPQQKQKSNVCSRFMLKDVLDLRRKKVENNSFRQELKEKKNKRQQNILSINKKNQQQTIFKYRLHTLKDKTLLIKKTDQNFITQLQ